jgi:hypothetical protein
MTLMVSVMTAVSGVNGVVGLLCHGVCNTRKRNIPIACILRTMLSTQLSAACTRVLNIVIVLLMNSCPFNF